MTNLSKDDLSLSLITTIKAIKSPLGRAAGQYSSFRALPMLGNSFSRFLNKTAIHSARSMLQFPYSWTWDNKLGNCILAPQVKPTKRKTPFYENSWIKLRNSTLMLLYTKPKVFVLSLSFGPVDHLWCSENNILLHKTAAVFVLAKPLLSFRRMTKLLIVGRLTCFAILGVPNFAHV